MATATARELRRRIGPAFFGHPRGLSTLFFSEMWERFSYYGMRAFLVLYMTAPLATGGMGLDTATAAADLRHLHVDGVPHEPAGRLDRRPADRPAARGAYGGILIAAGHFSLAVPAATARSISA